jgi:hypothetical protein
VISSDTTSQSAVVTSGSSLAWNHTVGSGNDRALIVGVGTRNSTPANAVVTNITYGGQELIKWRSDDGAASAYKRTELWALFDPPSGTAQIAVTLAGATSHFVVGAAISLFGADSIEASSGAGDQSGNPASHSITSLSDGALLIDACCHLGNTLAPGAQQTLIAKFEGVGASSDAFGMSYVQRATAGNQVFTWTSDAAVGWTATAVSVKAAPSGGGDMAIIQFKRGTRAQIDSAAGASQLRVAEPYLLTDEGRMALGLSATSYADLMMRSLDQPTCWPIRVATPKIAGDVNGTALSTITVTASRQYWIPMVVARKITLTGLRISVTTAATGAASIGLYSNRVVSGSDEPDQLLASVTGLDTGTTGDKTGTLSYTLQPGTIYWASVICAAAAVLRALAVGSVQPALGRTVNNTTMITYLYAAGSGSTLASPAPATFTAGTGVAPAIYLVGS